MKPSIHKRTQLSIGRFSLFHEAIEIYAWEDDSGGEYYLNPDPDRGKCARMRIGLNQPWPQVVEVLLHEALEGVMHRRGWVFQGMHTLTPDTSNRLFIFDHPQFTQLCGAVGPFMVEVMPCLKAAWDKLQLKQKQHVKRNTTRRKSAAKHNPFW